MNDMSKLLDMYTQFSAQNLQRQMHQQQLAQERERMQQQAQQFSQQLEANKASDAARIWESKKARDAALAQHEESLAQQEKFNLWNLQAQGSVAPGMAQGAQVPDMVGNPVNVHPPDMTSGGKPFMFVAPEARIEKEAAVKSRLKLNDIMEMGNLTAGLQRKADAGDPGALGALAYLKAEDKPDYNQLAARKAAAAASVLRLQGEVQSAGQQFGTDSPEYKSARAQLTNAESYRKQTVEALDDVARIWGIRAQGNGIPQANYHDKRIVTTHASRLVNTIKANIGAKPATEDDMIRHLNSYATMLSAPQQQELRDNLSDILEETRKGLNMRNEKPSALSALIEGASKGVIPLTPQAK